MTVYKYVDCLQKSVQTTATTPTLLLKLIFINSDKSFRSSLKCLLILLFVIYTNALRNVYNLLF